MLSPRNAMTCHLETERLIFRDWEPNDLEAFHKICSDSRVMRFVGDAQPWPIDRTRQFIARAIAMSAEHSFCQWPLILRSDSNLIGFCGFVPAVDGAEIGWRLAPEYWGRGLATEAARSALHFGFTMLAIPRITATVQAGNRASLRVIEKLGMCRMASFQRSGREVLEYAIARDTFELPNME